MSLFTMTQLPNWYFVSLINAEFISLYVDSFINNTSHFQINDARQLPIIIPNEETSRMFKLIADSSIATRKYILSSTIDAVKAEAEINKLQQKLDSIVRQLYKI